MIITNSVTPTITATTRAAPAGATAPVVTGAASAAAGDDEADNDTGVHSADFFGETFRVLKEKETAKYGEYRTRRLVLEAWDRLTK